MVAVERVNEYAKVSPENDNGDDKNLPENWPERGKISAIKASYQYHKSLPDVLSRIYFEIKSNEKVTKLFTKRKILVL